MRSLLLFFKRYNRRLQEWLDSHETIKRWVSILRLGLFQFGMGLTLAPLTGTLNRVLIDEMSISALIVGILISIHYFVSPVRAMIGFQSDKNRAIGRWRTPYVMLGAMLTFAGLVCAPFTLLILSGDSVIPIPFWAGVAVSIAIFLAYGIGANIVETIYLALVSDITPSKERGKVLAVLWIMLVLGTIVSSIIISYLLENYTSMRLIQVMQGSAVIFMILTFIALRGQEKLKPDGTVISFTEETYIRLSFWQSVKLLLGQQALRNLFIVLFIATTAFATHDVLLEPYGGQVLNMTVSQTTRLTAFWGLAMLVAITVSGWSLWKGYSPITMIKVGCGVGAIGFLVISIASNAEMVNPFRGGVWLIGMGRGVFIVASVALVMSLTDIGHAGLFIGLWGIMQALAQGFGTIFGSLVRDIAYTQTGSVVVGYVVVYGFSMTFLIISLGLVFALRLHRQLRADMLRSPWSGLQEIPADQIAF